ncbi:MAG: hypothetical protein HKN23_12455, partial [Verrucomicrobiales bacterium]|nr:hypothetical protein [Verrucomicrobiales bacterium]
EETRAALRQRLFDELKQTGDPRVIGGKVEWDYYPYYGKISNPARYIRAFSANPAFHRDGKACANRRWLRER